jgi:hypothetical protein
VLGPNPTARPKTPLHLPAHLILPLAASPAHHMSLRCGSHSPAQISSVAWSRFLVGSDDQPLLPRPSPRACGAARSTRVFSPARSARACFCSLLTLCCGPGRSESSSPTKRTPAPLVDPFGAATESSPAARNRGSGLHWWATYVGLWSHAPGRWSVGPRGQILPQPSSTSTVNLRHSRGISAGGSTNHRGSRGWL